MKAQPDDPGGPWDGEDTPDTTARKILWGVVITIIAVGALVYACSRAIAHVHKASGHDYGKLQHPINKGLCCNGQDCDEIAPERVKIVVGGYLVDGVYFETFRGTLPSWDGKYHACFATKPTKMRCLIAPIPGN